MAMTQAEREQSSNWDAAFSALGVQTPEQAAKSETFQLEALARQMPESDVEKVALRDVVSSPTNPRRVVGDIDDLVASVRKIGIIHPPLGRRLENGKVEVVIGSRRLEASKRAGLEKIPVDIRALTDNDVLELQANENLQRSDLHELEEAEHYGRMRAVGYSPETIAEKIGKQTSWVRSRLKLLELGAAARSAFFNKTIPLSVAIPLARVPGADKQEKALEMLTRSKMTAQQQIEILQREFCQNLKGSPFDLKDDTLVPEERDEKGTLLFGGSCVKCPQNSNNQPAALTTDLVGIERQGVCFNTPCFGAKCRAIEKRHIEKAKDRGAKPLTAVEMKKYISDGSLTYQSPVVTAETMVYEDPKKRTWEQVLDRADPPVQAMVGPDDRAPGKVLKLYDRREAYAAAKKLGNDWASSGAKEATTTKSEKDELSDEEKKERKDLRAKEKAARAKQEAVLQVTKMTIPKLVKDRWSSKAGLAELRVLANELYAKRASNSAMKDAENLESMFSGFDMEGARTGPGGRIPTERAIENWIDKNATEKQLIAFCMIITCFDKWTDTNDDFEHGFADLAFNAGADLKKGLRVQLETNAEEKKKEKKATTKGGKSK